MSKFHMKSLNCSYYGKGLKIENHPLLSVIGASLKGLVTCFCSFHGRMDERGLTQRDKTTKTPMTESHERFLEGGGYLLSRFRSIIGRMDERGLTQGDKQQKRP